MILQFSQFFFIFHEFSKIKILKNTENMKNHFLVKISSLGLAKVPKVNFSILWIFMDFSKNKNAEKYWKVLKEKRWLKIRCQQGRARSLEVILNFCNLNSCTLNLKGEGQAKAKLSIGGLYLLSFTSCNLIFESLNPKMSSSQHYTEVVNSLPLSASGKYLIFWKCQKNVTHIYSI